MTREEIISTSRTLLNAGSETTSSVLAAATYYLLQNPEMLHRAQSEVRAAFRTADSITLRSVSTPGLLPYLEAVIQEALRCFPPIPATLPRIVGLAGAVIDGYYVPKDVTPSAGWRIHRLGIGMMIKRLFSRFRWGQGGVLVGGELLC